MSRFKVRGQVPFLLTVDTTLEGSVSSPPDTFVLPLPGTGDYDYQVYWGDGSSEHHTENTSQTHVYGSPGTYTITITGKFPQIYFNYTGDCQKPIKVQLGDVGWLSMERAFLGCTNLRSVTGLSNTAKVTNFQNAWSSCYLLSRFDRINTSAGLNFYGAWSYCFSLTSFPLIDVSNGTIFSYAWAQCSGLTSFPLLNTSSGLSFDYAWLQCTGLTSFPAINTSAGQDFSYTWNGCTGLNGYNFPTLNLRNILSNTTNGANCFGGVTLSTASYSALLIDMALGTTTNVTFSGGNSKYNAGAVAARNTLTATRSWTVTDGGLG
jgi:hypothetical protein